MISAPSGSSSSTATAPRGSAAQSMGCSGGMAAMASVGFRPLATAEPNAPTVSASKEPMERAQRSLEGESTSTVGKSDSVSPNAEMNSEWHVASSHEKASGPPARRARSWVSISSCPFLPVLSGPPSRSATAHSPPRCRHSAPQLDADSSGRGPASALLDMAMSGSGEPPPAAAAEAPSSTNRDSMKEARKEAMLPKLNLPWTCGSNLTPCSATCWPCALPAGGSPAKRTSTAGTLSTPNCDMRLAGAKPKAICPSKATDNARKSGGTSPLSENRRQAAWVAEMPNADEKKMSMLAGPRRSTCVSGNEARAVFLAPSKPATSPAYATAFLGAFSAAPYRSTATAGTDFAPYLDARAAGARATTAWPKMDSASGSKSGTSPKIRMWASFGSASSPAWSSSLTREAAGLPAAAAAAPPVGGGAAWDIKKERIGDGFISPP
mmetsp:Transcript_25705/g.83031  ORF Transcript_25705/g.83031 Transcript_25705/m.83031 type:complete len:438 (+) Transcript_25705:119-1432(+)